MPEEWRQYIDNFYRISSSWQFKTQVYTCHDRDHTQPLYHCTPTTPQWHNSELRNLPENNATMTSVEVDPCGLSHLWEDCLCVWFWNLKSTGQADSCGQNCRGGARTPQRWTKTCFFAVVSDSGWVFAWYRAQAGALSHGNKHTQLTEKSEKQKKRIKGWQSNCRSSCCLPLRKRRKISLAAYSSRTQGMEFGEMQFSLARWPTTKPSENPKGMWRVPSTYLSKFLSTLEFGVSVWYIMW